MGAKSKSSVSARIPGRILLGDGIPKEFVLALFSNTHSSDDNASRKALCLLSVP